MTIGITPEQSQESEPNATPQPEKQQPISEALDSALIGTSHRSKIQAQEAVGNDSSVLDAISSDIAETQEPQKEKQEGERNTREAATSSTPEASPSVTPEVQITNPSTQDPVATQVQPKVFKPKGITIEGFRELVVDPSATNAPETTKKLHKLLEQIENEGGKVEYSLNKNGGIEFQMSFKEVEHQVRVQDASKWQEEMLQGLNAVVIQSALGRDTSSPSTAVKSSGRDLSAASHEELVAVFKSVHQELLIADLTLRHKTDLLECIEQNSDPRGLSRAVSRWAQKAGREIEKEAKDKLKISIDVAADPARQIEMLKRQNERDLRDLQRAEQQIMNLAQREYQTQLQFDTRMQQQLGGRKVDTLLKDLGSIEVSSDVKAKVDSYRNHDIMSNLATIAAGGTINPFPNSIAGGGVDFGLDDLAQVDPYRNSNTAASAYKGKTEELRAYLTKLVTEHAERETAIQNVNEQLELSGVLTGSSEQRVKAVENMIEGLAGASALSNLQKADGLSLQEQELKKLLEQSERNQEARDRLQGAKDYLGALRSHARDAQQAQRVYVRAIKQSYSNQFGREIDKGVQRGSRGIGRDIGGIVEDWAKEAGKELRDILGPKRR